MGRPMVGWSPWGEDVVRTEIGIRDGEEERGISASAGEDDLRRGPRQSL